MAATVNFQLCLGLTASFPSRAMNRLSREASALFLRPELTFCHASRCPASPPPWPAKGLVGLSLMTPHRKSLPLAAWASCLHRSLTFLTLPSPVGWQSAGCWKGSWGPWTCCPFVNAEAPRSEGGLPRAGVGGPSPPALHLLRGSLLPRQLKHPPSTPACPVGTPTVTCCGCCPRFHLLAFLSSGKI